jgi:hypothetical protein
MAEPRGASSAKPATEKQINMLWRLTKELGAVKVGEAVALIGKHPDEMSASEASAAIDKLMAEKKAADEAPAENLDEPQPWPDAT